MNTPAAASAPGRETARIHLRVLQEGHTIPVEAASARATLADLLPPARTLADKATTLILDRFRAAGHPRLLRRLRRLLPSTGGHFAGRGESTSRISLPPCRPGDRRRSALASRPSSVGWNKPALSSRPSRARLASC